jgi:SHAQKYF class myb-like DNA-binding protein
MSLVDSNYFPDLFLSENCNNYLLNYSTISDNLSDIFSDSFQEPKKKSVKFILTKEETPSFLKKKINLSLESKEPENLNGGRWNKEEQQRFAEAVLKYGNDWKQIQSHVFSRNMTQVRSHAQKFLMKLKETNFIINEKYDPNLSWTKMMNLLRQNVNYEKLKELLFSVEQNEEKEKRKKEKKTLNKSKIKKNKLNSSLNSENYSKCDTNGDSSRFFLDNEESNFENDLNKSIKIKEEEDEALEKFIECFNKTSQEINLNSSFEEIFYDKDEYINDVPNNENIKYKI